MIDGGVQLDLDAVMQNVCDAEIVCLYFPPLERTLLIDTRTAPGVDPFVGIVPIARSSAERVRSLAVLRPGLPQPQSITMIPWVRRVRSLVSCGVWTQVLARVEDVGAAQSAFDTLYALEMSHIRDAILGREYETIWARSDVTS